MHSISSATGVEDALQDEAGARRSPASFRRQALVGAPGTILFSLWAWIHLGYFFETGRAVGLVFAVQEMIVAVLFLARRPAGVSSRRPVDWAAAMFGSFGALLTAPGGEASVSSDVVGPVVQLFGLGFVVVSLIYLRRSFGMVAAHRGLVTHGPYGLVRHPMYVGYFFGQIGYAIQSPTVRNFVVLTAVWLCQIWRIAAEERLLSKDGEYSQYKQRVQARLVPGVW